ncbi:MAG: RluA family pseudouridine synthase, partial [Verrucomicrobia bacterium]
MKTDLAPIHVLHEDDALLVLRKPAGLVCHPTKGNAWSSLIGRVRLHLGSDEEPQMVHRLDRETSGVMVFGKTQESALELRRLWMGGFVSKQYLAIVHGHPPADSFVVDAPLGRDETAEVSIRDRVRPDGAVARTRFRVLSRFDRAEGPFALVAAWLDTGRKHQIRIHLAHQGYPVVGDKLYGGDESLYLAFVQRRLTPSDKARLLLPCQALHAVRLGIPWNGEERVFEAEPEAGFAAFLRGETVPWLADPFDPLR